MDWINRIKSSFSARISFRIILVVGVVFIFTFAITYNFSYRSIKQSAIAQAELTMKNASAEVEEVLERVSQSVDYMKVLVTKNVPIDTLYAIIRDFVANNDDIVGGAIAFEPYHFHSKGYYFSPYAYKENGNVYVKQLGTDEYDYFTMEWYQIPKLLNKDYWTEPYYDEGGGNTLMCTYSSIMRDENGKFVGVLTADISLEWLNELAQSLKPYPSSFSFLLGTGGTVIVHPDKDLVFNESIFSYALNQPDMLKLTLLGDKMVNGENGYLEFDNSGYLSHAFYAPIKQSGWSIAMVNTNEDIFSGLTRASRLLAFISIAGLLLIFIFCVLVIRKISAPLHQFSLSAKDIAHGNFKTQLPEIKSKDEMKELHNSFTYLQSELVNYIDTLKNTVSINEKIESELRIARSIQMGMVPKIFPAFPDRKDIDIFAILRPAKEVGGDLYDFFINNDKLYFAVGDVSGKGVPASLLMAVTRSLFRNVAASLIEPHLILESINNAIAEINEEDMFITFFVGILDLHTNKLSFANAGHNPPCVINEKGEAKMIPVKTNLPIGVWKDFQFEQQEAMIEAGETLFLYTDGITEAEDINAELYGEEKLMAVLNQSSECKAANELIYHILESVESHVGEAPQSDDLTMLAIKFKCDEIMNKKLVLKNNISEINTLTAFMEQIGEEAQLPMALLQSLILAMEEAVANVILYAYPQNEEHELSINFLNDGKELTFTIQDFGVPFDPLSVAEVDTSLSAEERKIGGLGIFLVKNIMTDVKYKRIGDSNLLILKKTL